MRRIITVKMPDIGEGVVEGEVIEWLKKPEEQVKQDEPVVIVMTDKATVELPSPCQGKLVKQYFSPGETAVKDKPLYDIETESQGEKNLASQQVQKTQDALPSKEKTSEPSPQTRQDISQSGKALATPRVRGLAKELQVDLSAVKASGKGGRVLKEDLRKHLSSSLSKNAASISVCPLPEDEQMPLIGIRHLMVKKMEEANREIPHFSYFEQTDATRLIQLREKINTEAAKNKIRLSFMPFFIRALSLTIKKYPLLNSSLAPDRKNVIIHQLHNIGIAMATPHGLIVPVLKGVQKLSLEELIKAYEQLKTNAASGKTHPSDMKEGTITLSNFGVLGGGGLWATPIISPPEVAILAVARIQKQPVVKNGEIVCRDVLNLSWSFDHRVIDGDLAASISSYYSSLIQNPAPLL